MGLWTNLLKQSANLDDTSSPWGGNGSFTIASATSIIPGETAWSHTNGGAGTFQGRTQTVGKGLPSGPVTVALAVENTDAATTEVGVFDTAAGGYVFRARLTWSTGEVIDVSGTPQGSAFTGSVVDLGGNRRLLVGTATPDNAGNGQDLRMFPTGTGTNTDTVVLHYAGLFEASTFAPAYLINGDTIQEHRVVDLSDYKVSFRPRQTAENLTHRRPRASGKMSTAIHSDAVRARTWSLETEIEDRATGEALQAELDAPGRIQVVHNPLIHPVTGVAVECEASNVRRLDGPQEDHVRLGFDLLEVRPL